MDDPQTDRLLAEVREVAAQYGLTSRPVSTEEFREMGRRALLRRGFRFTVTRSAPGVPLATSCWRDEEGARGRFRELTVSFGLRPGATIALMDEAERTLLAVWPEAL